MPRPRKEPVVEKEQDTPSIDQLVSEKINAFQESYDSVDFHMLADAINNYLYTRPRPGFPVNHTDAMRMQAIWDRHVGTKMDSTEHHLSAIALDIRAVLFEMGQQMVREMPEGNDNG